MRGPRLHIHDLPTGPPRELPELGDAELDVIVGGLIDDNTEPVTSLFDWDVTTPGFGFDGGSVPGGGGSPTPAPTPSTPACPTTPSPYGLYTNNNFPPCSGVIQFTRPDGGPQQDILGS